MCRPTTYELSVGLVGEFYDEDDAESLDVVLRIEPEPDA